MNESISQSPEKKETVFQRRFGEVMTIGGVETNIIDTAAEATSEKPDVFVAPGFKVSLHTNSPILEMIAEDGRRVVSLEHPQALTPLDGLSQSEKEQAANQFISQVRKASNLLELIDKKSPDKAVDFFAFSEGALNTILAAYLRPEKFNSIILDAPAGVIGTDSLWGLKTRFGEQAKTDDTVGMPSRNDFESQFPELAAKEKAMLDHLAVAWKDDEASAREHPMVTVQELWALSHMQIDTMIAAVRAAGVKIAIVSGIDDQVFPHDQIEKRFTAETIDGYMTIRGAHGPQYVARSINTIFDLLDAKREKDEREKESKQTAPQ